MMCISDNDVNEAAKLCSKMAGCVAKYPLMKTFEETLKANNVLQHPVQNTTGTSYYEFVSLSFGQIKRNVENFRKKVKQQLSLTPVPTQYSEYERITQCLINSCDTVQKVLEDCFKKKDKESGYTKLKSFLDSHKADMEALYSLPQDSMEDSVKYLYRMAAKSWSKKDRKSLFHPPFDVNKDQRLNYRYSGADFPSLYLGCSLELCLAEVCSTNKDGFYGAQFRLRKSETLKVLNLTYRWNEMSMFFSADANDSPKQAFFKGWLTLYPIMLASSVVKISSTKDEYILPQLLMRYVRESTDLDGIRYYSTKRHYVNNWTKKSLNFAFPAKGNKESGYDDGLIRKFELTEPIDLADYSDLNQASLGLESKNYESVM